MVLTLAMPQVSLPDRQIDHLLASLAGPGFQPLSPDGLMQQGELWH